MTQAHRKKFDEGIYVAEHHRDLPMLATGGADGILKIFEVAEASF